MHIEKATDVELLFELISRNKIHDAPTRVEHISKHKSICIGIGKDYTADIILDNDALDELVRLA